jgi:opacity protein-like surface antigen
MIMNFKKLILAAAALGLAGAVVPAVAQEQQHGDNRNGGQHDGQDWHGGDRHDNGQHGYRRNGHPEWGVVLGYDGSYPHYCRNHRHWRWNARRHAYVYSYRGGYC